MEIAFPATNHTGVSLRNLVNLIYSRGAIISKATGGIFGADDRLVEALKDNECVSSFDACRQAVKEYENRYFGIWIEPDKVVFTGFPETDVPGKYKAFTDLALAMNYQAILQKRIQAKIVYDENEKYIFRIWLVRIGLGGEEYKETRRFLMENLSGNAAIRNPIDLKKLNLQ